MDNYGNKVFVGNGRPVVINIVVLNVDFKLAFGTGLQEDIA